MNWGRCGCMQHQNIDRNRQICPPGITRHHQATSTSTTPTQSGHPSHSVTFQGTMLFWAAVHQVSVAGVALAPWFKAKWNGLRRFKSLILQYGSCQLRECYSIMWDAQQTSVHRLGKFFFQKTCACLAVPMSMRLCGWSWLGTKKNEKRHHWK